MRNFCSSKEQPLPIKTAMMADHLPPPKRAIHQASISLSSEIETFAKLLTFPRTIASFVPGIKEETPLKIEHLTSLFWFSNAKKKIKYIFFKDIFDSCTCLFLSKIVVYLYSPHLKNIHVTIYIMEAKLHKTYYVMGMILLNQVPVCYINNLRI